MANIIEITNFNAPELDVYARMTENQLINRHEPEKGMFIAESPKVIEVALNSGCVPVSLLLEKKHIEGEAREIIKRCGDIPVYTADFDVLTQLTGFKLTRGALCAMRRPTPKSVGAVLDGARRVAVLESVMNPTNIGAIFRSAAALNMDAVLLTPDCSNPLYRRSIRVSMGTVFQIPWTFIESDTHSELSDCSHAALNVLKSHGFKTVAMALRNDSVSIDEPKLRSEEMLAVILGSEGYGLKPETIDACDYTVKIPMAHGVDSLNVAAASAVAFWELGRR